MLFRSDAQEAAHPDDYAVLGVSPSAPMSDVKAAWRKLSREHHPDTLIAKGMPQEYIDLATKKMAEINAHLSELSAQQALFQGQNEIAKLTRGAGQLKSKQRVAMAANGIDLGVGNASLLISFLQTKLASTALRDAARSIWIRRRTGRMLSPEGASRVLLA